MSARPRRDVAAFLRWVDGEAASAGVRLDFRPRARSRRGQYRGWFNHEDRVLTVCVASPEWLLVLAHEISHLRQWVERRRWFEAADAPLFEAWVAGKQPRMKPARLTRCTRAIQKVEADAERRAVGLMDHFHLVDSDVARASYIAEANLYVWSYEIARRKGFWPSYGQTLAAVVAKLPAGAVIPDTDLGKPPDVMEACAGFAANGAP